MVSHAVKSKIWLMQSNASLDLVVFRPGKVPCCRPRQQDSATKADWTNAFSAV